MPKLFNCSFSDMFNCCRDYRVVDGLATEHDGVEVVMVALWARLVLEELLRPRLIGRYLLLNSLAGVLKLISRTLEV